MATHARTHVRLAMLLLISVSCGMALNAFVRLLTATYALGDGTLAWSFVETALVTGSIVCVVVALLIERFAVPPAVPDPAALEATGRDELPAAAPPMERVVIDQMDGTTVVTTDQSGKSGSDEGCTNT